MAPSRKLKPLENRPFRLKRPHTFFYCPLCRTERELSLTFRPTPKHYVQLGITSVFFMLLTYPFIGLRSFPCIFFFWMILELGLRVAFKKEVPCPYCGLDVTLYLKDVRVAKQKVQQFWADKKNSAPQLWFRYARAFCKNAKDNAFSSALGHYFFTK